MTGRLASFATASERTAAEPGGLSDVFDELSYNLNRESALDGVKLGVLMSAVGRRSYGPLFLIVGLLAISPATVLPGMTSLTALVILLIALQMALGFKRPWLPKAMLDIRVSRDALFSFLHRARPVVDRLDGALLRPRWTFLAEPFGVNLVALCIMAVALVTFPLSLVPFAPLAPGLAVVLFGLGMTARDGLWLAVGIGLTALIFLLTAPLLF